MSNSRELIEESINGIITLAKKLLLMNSSKKSRLSCGAYSDCEEKSTFDETTFDETSLHPHEKRGYARLFRL
jgi:hypothetical protein